MTAREKARRVLLVVATLAVVVMVLYPPWQRTACHISSTLKPVALRGCYTWLWKPPSQRLWRWDDWGSDSQIGTCLDPQWLFVNGASDELEHGWTIEARVDVIRLLVQCVAVLLLAGLGWVLLRPT
jgi:hypothetical protein